MLVSRNTGHDKRLASVKHHVFSPSRFGKSKISFRTCDNLHNRLAARVSAGPDIVRWLGPAPIPGITFYPIRILNL